MTPSLSVCVEMLFSDVEPFADRIELVEAAGADAFEFWGWRDKDLDAVADARDDAGIGWAAMTAGGGDLTDPGSVEESAAAIEESIETAAEYGCPTLIVTVGQELDGHSRDAQRDAVVDALSRAAPAAEDAGVALAVEPLNTRVDHPGYFLTTTEEGLDVVEAVDSPSVGLLFDVYHQQITEGDVTRRLTEHVEEVKHVHVADNPGRNEPGTGELSYETILDALADAGYDGYVGCEFRALGDDAAAVADAAELV